MGQKESVRGLGRREAIRQAAIVAGAAWAAPVLQTVGAPARAQGSPLQECDCEFRMEFVRQNDGSWACQSYAGGPCPPADTPTPNCRTSGCERVSFEVTNETPSNVFFKLCLDPGCHGPFAPAFSIESEYPCGCGGLTVNQLPPDNCVTSDVSKSCDPAVYPDLAITVICDC